MTRKIVAVVIGVIVAVGLVFIVQTIGHNIYPVAGDVNVNNKEQLAELIGRMPLGALLFVPASWFAGAVGGGLVAVVTARGDQALLLAATVATFILVAGGTTLITIPHPIWLVITGIAAVLLSPFVACKLAALVTSANRSPASD